MDAASTMTRCISTGSEPKSNTMVCLKVPKISVLKATATWYTQWSRPLSAETVVYIFELNRILIIEHDEMSVQVHDGFVTS